MPAVNAGAASLLRCGEDTSAGIIPAVEAYTRLVTTLSAGIMPAVGSSPRRAESADTPRRNGEPVGLRASGWQWKIRRRAKSGQGCYRDERRGFLYPLPLRSVPVSGLPGSLA